MIPRLNLRFAKFWKKINTSDKAGYYFFRSVISYGLFFYTFGKYFYGIHGSVGKSMSPTINEGDLHVVKRLLLYKLQEKPLKANDIVVCLDPSVKDKNFYLCKRIIYTEGQEGETTYRGNKVTIKVPEGHIWIEGDNKKNSHDSRAFGPIPIGLVKGKLLMTIYPSFKRYP